MDYLITIDVLSYYYVFFTEEMIWQKSVCAELAVRFAPKEPQTIVQMEWKVVNQEKINSARFVPVLFRKKYPIVLSATTFPA